MINEITIIILLLTIAIHVILYVYVIKSDKKIRAMIEESRRRDIEFWKMIEEMVNNDTHNNKRGS